MISDLSSLIAIMLGRLQMSTEDALKQYNNFAKQVFSQKNQKWMGQHGLFRASTFKSVVKKMVKESNQDYTGDEHMHDGGLAVDMCKV